MTYRLPDELRHELESADEYIEALEGIVTGYVESCAIRTADTPLIKKMEKLMSSWCERLKGLTADYLRQIEAETSDVKAKINSIRAKLHPQTQATIEDMQGFSTLGELLDVAVVSTLDSCLEGLSAHGRPQVTEERIQMGRAICEWMMKCYSEGANKLKPTTTRGALFERLITEAMKKAGEDVTISDYSYDGKPEHNVKYCPAAHELAEDVLKLYRSTVIEKPLSEKL